MTGRPRVLVVRLSAFGDVIHTIPAVVALRDHFEITWAVEPAYLELVEIVAKVATIPVALKKRSWRNIVAARRSVRGFRTSIDFQGLIKSSLVARASGAQERYGFARDAIREKPAAWFANRHVSVDTSRHVVEWNLALARAAAPSIQRVPDVDYTPFAAEPNGALAAFTGRVVLIPGAGRDEKRWPVERFAELARRLGRHALVVWGPGEEALARSIGAEVAPPTSFRELAFLLAGAAMAIGGDTGPLHLAAALGTRVVGLYGPTNPARNGPYGQRENVISTYAQSRSMDAIAVDDVLRAIDKLKINLR